MPSCCYAAGELGVPTWQLPVLWCVFHIAKSTGNMLLGRAVDRFGPKPFLFLGWLVYAAIYLAFALATTPREAWIFFLSYAVFYGLTEPAEKTLVVNLAGGERKGLAFGWFNFAIGIATLPASLIFGAVSVSRSVHGVRMGRGAGPCRRASPRGSSGGMIDRRDAGPTNNQRSALSGTTRLTFSIPAPLAASCTVTITLCGTSSSICSSICVFLVALT